MKPRDRMRQPSGAAERHDAAADDAAREIWRQWFTFYSGHFRGEGVTVSAADQMAFYEIAQPIMRKLVEVMKPPAKAEG